MVRFLSDLCPLCPLCLCCLVSSSNQCPLDVKIVSIVRTVYTNVCWQLVHYVYVVSSFVLQSMSDFCPPNNHLEMSSNKAYDSKSTKTPYRNVIDSSTIFNLREISVEILSDPQRCSVYIKSTPRYYKIFWYSYPPQINVEGRNRRLRRRQRKRSA